MQVAAELAAIFEPSRLSLRGLVSAGYQPRPGLQVDTDELGKCLKTNLRVEDLIVDDYWLSKREARKHWSRVEKEERLARRGGSAASGMSSSGAESSASGEDEWTGASASEGRRPEAPSLICARVRSWRPRVSSGPTSVGDGGDG